MGANKTGQLQPRTPRRFLAEILAEQERMAGNFFANIKALLGE